MSDFHDLLQEAEKLTVEIEGTETNKELPKVDRSLQQVLEASKDLYSKVAPEGSRHIQANILLGSKGIELPKITQKLESISTKRNLEPIEPVGEVKVKSILDNAMHNVMLKLFIDLHNDTMTNIRTNALEHTIADWKREKRKILNAMTGPNGKFVELGRSPDAHIEKEILITSNMGVAESLFAKRIIEYNRSVVNTLQKPNLINSFIEVANELRDAKVKDMWEIVKYMIQLPSIPQNSDILKARSSPEITNALVKQAKCYLEDRYKIYLSSVINDNLQIAELGGVPGTYPLVRSFVGVRLQGEYSGLKDDKIDNRPLWPMVYYCLRCGDLQAALHCLQKRGNGEFNDIVNLLNAKIKSDGARNPEIGELENSIGYAYRRNIRNETDPFKRIVFAVLSCCDVMDEHSEVARTADDYLWLKLNLVRVKYDKDEHIKYHDLQRTISEEYGEAHYNADQQPHLYFAVLFLTGQFETAIEFIARTQRYTVHAMHMALLLHELKMLAEPRHSLAPLLTTDRLEPKPSARLNLYRFIMIYTRRFEIACPNEALHYYFFLRNYTNDDEMNLFKACVADLVLDTKNYSGILGTVQDNGVRSKGLIDQFLSADITLNDLSDIVAERLKKNGLSEEAINVYDIVDNQEEVLKIFCMLLSQVVTKPSSQAPLKARLVEKANIHSNRYAIVGYNASSESVNTFIRLKQLAVFFDQYFDKQYSKAMKTLYEIQIFPRKFSELTECVKLFDKLAVQIGYVIPDALLAAMNMLYDEYQKINSNEYIPNKYKDDSIEKHLKHLREEAKVLVNYAGSLPFRLPGKTNSILVQMEILMH